MLYHVLPCGAIFNRLHTTNVVFIWITQELLEINKLLNNKYQSYIFRGLKKIIRIDAYTNYCHSIFRDWLSFSVNEMPYRTSIVRF